MDEWLTPEAAKEYYGVEIDILDAEALDYRINEKKTAELRAKLEKQGFALGLGSHQLHPKTRDIKLAWNPTEEEVQQHITVSRPPGW